MNLRLGTREVTPEQWNKAIAESKTYRDKHISNQYLMERFGTDTVADRMRLGRKT